jgi:hypothetical protein
MFSPDQPFARHEVASGAFTDIPADIPTIFVMMPMRHDPVMSSCRMPQSSLGIP